MVSKVLFIAPSYQLRSRSSDADRWWPIFRDLINSKFQVEVLAKRSFIGRSQVERQGVRVYFLDQFYPLNPK